MRKTKEMDQDLDDGVPPISGSVDDNIKGIRQRRRYSSTEELIDANSKDREFAESLKEKLSERNIIDMLMALRVKQGISQKGIAEQMKCSQSRISKLEAGKDDDLRIGDFHAYAAALGLDMMILLGKKNKSRTIVDQVKQHAFAIKGLLHRLGEMALVDASIARGVRDFYCEAAINLGRIVEDAVRTVISASKHHLISPLPQDERPLIRMENNDSDEEDVVASNQKFVGSNS